MPILYEPVFQMKKLRPKRTSILQQAEPNYYHVIEEYAVSSIYLTPDKLRTTIRDGLANACQQKGEKLAYFGVLQEWALWKVFYTEYHIKYEAYIGGSPIAQLVAVAIILLLIAILIVFAIWLVKQYVFEPIWAAIPAALKSAIGTLLLVGVGIAAIGGGIYLISTVLPRIR